MRKMGIFLVLLMLLPLLNFGEVEAVTWDYKEDFEDGDVDDTLDGWTLSDAATWYCSSLSCYTGTLTYTKTGYPTTNDHMVLQTDVLFLRNPIYDSAERKDTMSSFQIKAKDNVYYTLYLQGKTTTNNDRTLYFRILGGSYQIVDSWSSEDDDTWISLGTLTIEIDLVNQTYTSTGFYTVTDGALYVEGSANNQLKFNQTHIGIPGNPMLRTDAAYILLDEMINDFSSATISKATGNVPSNTDMQYLKLDVQDSSGGVNDCEFSNTSMEDANGTAESLNDSWSSSLPTGDAYTLYNTGWEEGNGIYFYSLSVIGLDGSYTLSVDIAKTGYNPTSAFTTFSVSGHVDPPSPPEDPEDPDFILDGVFLTVTATSELTELPAWNVVVENQSGDTISYKIDQEIYDPESRKLECETVNDSLVNGLEKVHAFGCYNVNTGIFGVNYNYPAGSYNVQTIVIVEGIGTLTGDCSIDYQTSSDPSDPSDPVNDEDKGIIKKITGIPGTVVEKATDLWNWTKEKLGSGGSKVVDAAKKVGGTAKDAAKKVYDFVKDKVPNKVHDIVDWVKDVVTENPISDWLGNTFLGTLGNYIPIILLFVGGLIFYKVFL